MQGEHAFFSMHDETIFCVQLVLAKQLNRDTKCGAELRGSSM